jgi:outer membrane lipoprotein-sorting protein
MYVYLPAFKKVRRIASYMTDQGFMGMNFTQDDMSITGYAKMFNATVASDDGKTQKLVLTAKDGANAPYAKVEMTVEKARNLPLEMKYFTATGAHTKTESRSDYTCENGFCAPGALKMVDHTKGGQSTTLSRKLWKVNVEIPDDRFSKRKLEEG